ncbi:MAG TPA: hypothetical protein ENF25_00820 [Thermoprotei archaeon]|nr:UPF0147 family protein [Euryarchaeota archaeon]MCD6158359.1 UPF0147 family protein [Euryarchaeota archaeon]HDJ50730.1 hypothetical protein [Thermoprotei archaeon]
MSELNEIVKQVVEILDGIIEEEGVPRNIKRGANEAKELISSNSENIGARAASAISILNELIVDPNTPIHVRTQILSAIALLERLTKE